MKKYFEFSSSEKKGIMLLMTLMLAVLTINHFLPGMVRYPRVDHSAIIHAIAQHRDSVLMAASMKDTVPVAPQKQPRKQKFVQKTDHVPVIKINECDTSDLKKLPGIGPVYAKRILKYRELLGGYHTAGQLLEVYGMDSSRYLGILPYIVVDSQNILRINVNRLSFSELLAHPYLEYEDVKMIFKARDVTGILQHFGGFDTLFPSGNAKWQKVAPYLRCGEP